MAVLMLLMCLFETSPVIAQWSREYGYYQPVADPNVCSRDTCKLPKCFCAGKEAPLRMDPDVIPQIVMFTFDDAVNEQVIDYYTGLFPQERVNPNGCPVTVTFFVSHNWTDYDMVKSLYARGHEIASHSISHRMPQSWWRHASVDEWRDEIAGQRDNIVEKAGIPRHAVTGVRAPFLDTGGDEQYNMMEKSDFDYDASFMSGPHDNGGVWPFTLDTVPNWRYCTNLNCPKDRHPGIWEVPLNRWVGIDGNGCSMVDSCQQQPGHKGEALAYLWQNFNRHYYGNRSPVGVNMHATWFKSPHHYDAMEEFVKTISEMDDVYLITVQQTLAWMQNPQTIERSVKFRPWLKSCSILPRGNLPLPQASRSNARNNIPATGANEQPYNSVRPRNRNRFVSEPRADTADDEVSDVNTPTEDMYYTNMDGGMFREELIDAQGYSDDDSDSSDNINVFTNSVNKSRPNNNAIDPDFDRSEPKQKFDLVRDRLESIKRKEFRRNKHPTSLADNSPAIESTDGDDYYDDSETVLSTTPPIPARKPPPRQNIRVGQRLPNASHNNPARRPRPRQQDNQATRQQRLARANSAYFAHAHNAMVISGVGLVLTIVTL